MERSHLVEYNVTMKLLPQIKDQKDESPQGNCCIQDEQKVQNKCELNYENSILSKMKKHHQFMANPAIDDSFASDSKSPRKENNEEEKQECQEESKYLDISTQPNLELKQSKLGKNVSQNKSRVPPAVKAPLHSKKKLGERKFQCKSLSETFDLKSLKKFDSKEILKDLSKNQPMPKIPLFKNNL